MFLEKILGAWKKRARRHVIEKSGDCEWRTFVKALCNSVDACRGFPYDCACCFEGYFNPEDILGHLLEQEQ